MVEGPSTPLEQSLTRNIEDVLGGLESELSELAIVPFEVCEQLCMSAGADYEVPEDWDLEPEAKVVRQSRWKVQRRRCLKCR